MSRTAQALAWLAANPGRTPYAAAKQFGIGPTAVYAALRRKKPAKCPTCGRAITQPLKG
jgi:hypothetical protein